VNAFGQNPAFAGTHDKFEIIMGRRMQWYGFAEAPTTTFMSGTYTIKNKYSYKGWHAVGIYVEEDKQGLFVQKNMYASYSYHLRINNGLKLSAGIFAGVKQGGLSAKAYSVNDPALQNNNLITMYPDFIPGLRLYSKTFFLDLSVKQLYKNTYSQGKNKIGTNSKLPPHLYLTFGRKFRDASNEFLFIPSLHLQSVLLGLPTVDASLYVYYRQRIGIGAKYSVNNSVAGIVQIHFLKNAMIGLAYEYTTSKFRFAAANTFEVIMGIIPVGGDDKSFNRNRVARCPDFDF